MSTSTAVAKKETIAPEHLEVANEYLQYGNIRAVSQSLQIPEHQITEILTNAQVRNYLDNVYLDLGYRNRNNLASLMDDIIASKLEEAEETGMYSKKDLVDILQLAHKMRMEEIKAMNDREKNQEFYNQTNIQVNKFGEGNYGKLMERLLNGEKEV